MDIISKVSELFRWHDFALKAKGHNSVKTLVALRYLFSAYLLIVFYICTSLRENMSEGYIIKRARFMTDRQTVGWFVVLGLTALGGSILVIYRAVAQRGGERRENRQMRKQKCPNNPTRSHRKCSRPLPHHYPN